MRNVAAITATIALSACATTLTEPGSAVVIVDRPADHDCKFLATVSASNTAGISMADNANGAMNELRNKAAAMSANAVHLLNVNSDANGTVALAEALKCAKVP